MAKGYTVFMGSRKRFTLALRSKHAPTPIPDNVSNNYKRNFSIPNELRNGMWKGQSCFLIGGGPSLIDFDFSQLDNENTIGVNKTCLYYPNCNINYAMDWEFYKMMTIGKDEEIKRRWKAYGGIKVFPSPISAKRKKQFKDVALVGRLLKRVLSLDMSAGLYFGNNSGFGALMLAATLGANPIYLLGYDLKVEGDSSHWHEGYLGVTYINQKRKLRIFTKIFIEFSQIFKDAGINIINLSPHSALECFSKMKFDQIKSNAVIENETPIIVSFYTKDTPYVEETKRLRQSLEKLGIDYDIIEVDNLGSWNKNTRQKPHIIKAMLDKHAPRSVLYVDCDAEFIKKSNLTDKTIEKDVAAHVVNWADYNKPKRGIEFLGGTLYFKNSDNSRRIISEWIKLCDEAPLNYWEQKCLAKVVEDGKFTVLPKEYCCIFDHMKVEDPIILHHQVSRKYRKLIS